MNRLAELENRKDTSSSSTSEDGGGGGRPCVQGPSTKSSSWTTQRMDSKPISPFLSPGLVSGVQPIPCRGRRIPINSPGNSSDCPWGGEVDWGIPSKERSQMSSHRAKIQVSDCTLPRLPREG